MSRIPRLLYVALCVIAVSSPSFGEVLRVVDYNITASGGAPRTGLSTILQGIGSESVNGVAEPIDLIGMEEMQSQATTGQDVVTMLNGIYGANTYARGNLNGASTGAGTQGVVYNQNKLQLLSETAIGVSDTNGEPRQTLRYEFHVLGSTGSAGDFYVYVSHLKASDDTAAANVRNAEAQAIRADSNTLGNAQIIYMGDYNIYRSSEPTWTTITSPGAGKANDPYNYNTPFVNEVGSWHNNGSFLNVLTQAPANNPPSGLTGGGLDDRFDFQLISDELADGTGLDYLPNSYHPFGNNGSVPLNGDINSPSSTALAGLSNRTTILNDLTTVTDHLPVVADYDITLAPEPSSLALLGVSTFLLFFARRRTFRTAYSHMSLKTES